MEEQNSICGKCGDEFGPGKFCVNCGSSVEDSNEATRIASGIRDFKAERKAWAAKHKKGLRASLALLITAGAYGIIQAGLFVGIGPDAVLNKYLEAIRAGDQTVIADSEIFSSPKSLTVGNEVLGKFRNPQATEDALLQSVNRTGYTASAVIVSKLGNLNLQLSGNPIWVLGFQVPNWRIDSSPTRISFAIGKVLGNKQELSDGSGNLISTVEDLRAQVGGTIEIHALPGQYMSMISPLGLLPETTVEARSWGESNVNLKIEPGEIQLTQKTRGMANEKAKAFAKSCVYNKCMRKFSETDFNLWSQFIATGYNYTSSRFDVKYSLGKCELVEIIATNPKEAEASYICDYSAKGHLYVRYTYYSGYFSDYYYYWNFYDTKDGYFGVTVPILSNIDGTVQTVGKAS